MKSISNFVTEKQAKDYLESVADFDQTAEILKEFAIDVKVERAEGKAAGTAGSTIPFIFQGTYYGSKTIEKEKENGEKKSYTIHYLQVLRPIGGKKMPIMISFYSYRSFETSIKNLDLKEGEDIVYKYLGMKASKYSSNNYHACYITKVQSSKPAPMDEKQATSKLYEDINSSSDDLPF